MNNIVVGLYDHDNAVRAMEVLEDYGVEHEQISVVARDIDKVEPHADTCAFIAPEFGQVIATGTLGIELFTRLETKATSSLSEALVNTGFSEEQADLYVEGLKRGDILVSVETGLQDEAESAHG